MSYSRKANGLLNDYMNIRTLPAGLSVAFIAASLYQFGGVTALELPWISYTLTTEHALVVSLVAFVAAFMSSETKDFQHYEGWEQAAIALGPAVILGQQYVTEVNDFLVGLGDPLGYQLAFIATVVSWAVAVQ